MSALSVVATAFWFPPLFYVLLFRDGHDARNRLTPLSYVLAAITIVVGTAGTIVGVYYGITGLQQAISAQPSPFSHYWTPEKME